MESTPCPDDDTLGAMVERSLEDAETERVQAHLDTCQTCRAIVVAAVRGGVATPVTMVDGQAEPERGRARIGSKIGRYEVRRLLGAGGMGHVYEAHDGELDRAIALKVLRPELAGSAPMLAERLRRESRSMAKVVHPAVITVHDVGRDGDAVFIAMELIRGETLASYVTREPRSWREVAELYERAGEGLIAAHLAGVVHRDFKPDNVLIETATKRVIVTDFGIARAASDDAVDEPPSREPSRETTRAHVSGIKLTTTGAAIGTPAYMAPEQLAAGATSMPVDQRADVFAFAVSLWEALFGTRPFAGSTVAEIKAAMKLPPRPRTGVPRRLVRVLESALAIAPNKRPALPAVVAELAAVRARGKQVRIAAAGVGLVAVGIAGALVLARPSSAPDDPCAAGFVAFTQKFDATRALAVHGALAAEREIAANVLAKLDATAVAWRKTHDATCRADRQPAQHPTTTACLDARRLEIAGYVDDVIADGPKHALPLMRTIGDPATCATPAPSLASANVPDDPALRRRVTQIRYRSYEAGFAADRSEPETAIKLAKSTVSDARTTWPRLAAETLYMLGWVQRQSGDNKSASKSYREAAAIAQTSHHDQVAARSWIELTSITTLDDGDPARGLEYLTYAEAAADRIGRPAALEAFLMYVKGTTLIEAGRIADAEVALRRAVELAETTAPDYLTESIHGLGYLYERQGRYVDAVAAYRRAIASLGAAGLGDGANDVILRTRLALNLDLLGDGDKAEVEARRAVELSEKLFAPDNTERAVAYDALATVLHSGGKLDAALAVVRATLLPAAKAHGERTKRYAEVLHLEGEILDSLHRYVDAAKAFARACDIFAFEGGEESTPVALCRVSEAKTIAALGRKAEALASVDKALPLLETGFDKAHPRVANALVARGKIHAELRHHEPAMADLERAIAILEKAPFDPGLLGTAQLALAKELWASDQKRARDLLDASITRLAAAPAIWKSTHDDALAWRNR